jgi:hypothetical protein
LTSKEQYRHAQSKIPGKTPRSLKRGTITVLEFVNQHRGKSWRELFHAWNEAHPRHRFKDRSHLHTTYTRAVEYVAGVKPAKGRRPKIAGIDSHGFPIYTEKWYLLHDDGYTGTFESREEAQADLRSENSEVLASDELVARLAERLRENEHLANSTRSVPFSVSTARNLNPPVFVVWKQYGR